MSSSQAAWSTATNPTSGAADPQAAQPPGDTSVVHVVDPAAGKVVHTIQVPGRLVGTAACDPSARAVYLDVLRGPTPGVRALDTESLALGDPIPAQDAAALAVDPTTGELWVAGGGTLRVLG